MQVITLAEIAVWMKIVVLIVILITDLEVPISPQKSISENKYLKRECIHINNGFFIYITRKIKLMGKHGICHISSFSWHVGDINWSQLFVYCNRTFFVFDFTGLNITLFEQYLKHLVKDFCFFFKFYSTFTFFLIYFARERFVWTIESSHVVIRIDILKT